MNSNSFIILFSPSDVTIITINENNFIETIDDWILSYFRVFSFYFMTLLFPLNQLPFESKRSRFSFSKKKEKKERQKDGENQ